MLRRKLENPDNVLWNRDVLLVAFAIHWISEIEGKGSAASAEITRLLRPYDVGRKRVVSIINALLTTRFLTTCPERHQRKPMFGPGGSITGYTMIEVPTYGFMTSLGEEMNMQARALFERKPRKDDDDGE